MKLLVKKFANRLCNFKNHLRIEYNRETNEIELYPCTGLVIKKHVSPFYWDSDYFINNIDKCIADYLAIDTIDLNDYYSGNCELYISKECKSSKLCTNYSKMHKLISVEVSIEKTCNFRCKKCLLTHEFNSYEHSLYIKLLDYFKNVDLDDFYFTCVGEPFIYKNIIFDFIKNSKTKKIHIVSNFSLLNDSDITELSKYQDKLVLIASIDSLNKDTYNLLTNSNCFNKVKTNIDKLSELGLINVINCVIQPENEIEITKIKDYYKNKVNKISLLKLIKY